MLEANHITKNGNLSYTRQGNGQSILLLFHGFGQSRKAFQPIADAVSKRHTLYIFDLFFHGESTWHSSETPLEKATWLKLMDEFFRQNAIDCFSVMGFSMGGKFALATLEAFPDRTRAIYLLAPDGIKTSFWYSLATYPVALRHLFKSMIDHPKRFQSIARWAHRLRLIDKGILRFVEHQMNTEEKRARVYYSWVVFRHLTFDLPKIAGLMNERNIELTLLVGRYDKIITAANMNRLLRHVHHHRFEILEAGHNDLIEKSVPFFVANGSRQS